MEEYTQKSHRKKQSGPNSEKSKNKAKTKPDLSGDPQLRNPKAFSVQSVKKVARAVRRTLDIKEKKQYIPVVDRTPVEPPPILVAIVGPPKVGKTTLIQCLIKNFTKQKLAETKGPITVVSGKKRRLTFIECNNDINSMIDVAKVADLVLLLVDASFGFEMETFEFLNICQVHGFPKIMGVLTHLDMFKDNKALRKTKKRLKHRFWTEIYQGAKLFYLSGMVNGEYQKTEIHNLGRFISVMKFRPLQWRQTHPYIIADRMEDVTDPETARQNPKCDRSVCLYGYVRGTNFRNKSAIHLAGCGDFNIHDMSFLSDPCPLPEREKEKRRSLNIKERLIYAPMSGVGGIVYDKDAVYIDLGGSHSHKNEEQENKPSNELVASMIGAQNTLDEKMAKSKLNIFSDTKALKNDEIGDSESEENTDGVPRKRRRAVTDSGHGSEVDSDDDEDDDDDDDEDDEEESDQEDDEEEGEDDDDMSDEEEDDDSGEEEDESETEELEKLLKSKKENFSFADSENESENEESDDEGHLKWKDNLAVKASEAFMRRKETTTNWRKLVYGTTMGEEEKESEDDEEVGGLFKISGMKQREKKNQDKMADGLDSSKFEVTSVQDWDLEEIMESIKDCFVTGKWKESEDAETLLKEDDEMFGDFEDLETGEKFGEKENEDESMSENSDDDDKDDEKKEEENGVPVVKEKLSAKQKGREKYMEKKKRLKDMFDKEYDDAGGNKGTYFEDLKSEMDQQAQLNRAEFENMDEETRANYEGFRPGIYVRVQVNGMPCEFVENFDSEYPVLMGGILSAEQNIGYVQVRLKKHRWFKRVLKTRDPVILSMGWRRFQSISLYSIQDHNMRHRLLKYTPEHLHCNATFWGPITPQGTGVLAIQSVSDKTTEFRVTATGVVLELDKSMTIVKKLKLTGTPFKIFKKTAFIKDMFNSALEVAKFEGSTIKTVSGLRGQIKKAVQTPPGAFRATFEDKILMSDIAFVRTWYPVEVPKFYNPVTTLLLPTEEKKQWLGMKTVGQLKREKGIRNQVNTDSLYNAIERLPRTFKPLVIPRELQKNLPFKDKPKIAKRSKDKVQSDRVAVVMEPKERKVASLMKMLKTVHKHKMSQRRVEMRSRAADHQKKNQYINEKREQKQKKVKKEIYRVMGQIEKKKNKGKRD